MLRFSVSQRESSGSSGNNQVKNSIRFFLLVPPDLRERIRNYRAFSYPITPASAGA